MSELQDKAPKQEKPAKVKAEPVVEMVLMGTVKNVLTKLDELWVKKSVLCQAKAVKAWEAKGFKKK